LVGDLTRQRACELVVADTAVLHGSLRALTYAKLHMKAAADIRRGLLKSSRRVILGD
jgi:hypothetical protein